MAEIDLAKLKEPFSQRDIVWRVQSCGNGTKGIWARVLAYITSRAIMDRLDDVCGPANWQNTFDKAPEGGVMCGISIRINGEWVTKWDVAANTEVKEAGKLDVDTNIKGGFSASMKRAGVQWGIGRYLYDIGADYAIISPNGRYSGKVRGENGGKDLPFRWDPPKLPNSALPKAEWSTSNGTTPPKDQTPPPKDQTPPPKDQTPPPKKQKPTRKQKFNLELQKAVLSNEEAQKAVYSVIDRAVYPQIGEALDALDDVTFRRVIDAIQLAGVNKEAVQQ